MTNILKTKTVHHKVKSRSSAATAITGAIIPEAITIQSLHAFRSRKDGPY